MELLRRVPLTAVFQQGNDWEEDFTIEVMSDASSWSCNSGEVVHGKRNG